MRIAMIGQKGIPAEYGGVERAVEEVSARLVERGHQVTVFNSKNGSGPHPVDHRGIELRYLTTPDSKHLGQFVQSLRATLAATMSDFEIVHFHALGPCLFSPIARTRTSARIIATVQGRDDQRAKWNKAAQSILEKAALVTAKVPHEVICVSQQLQNEFMSEFGRATTHIPNGVAPPPPAPSCYADHDRPERRGLTPGRYLMMVGRLVPEKAADVLIHAYKQVPTSMKLAIVGGSSHTDGYVRRLEALAAEDDRVVLTGPVYGDALDALYRYAAGYVMPSLLEGLPLALLEAISYGLPVVVSDIAPHIEVVGSTRPGARVTGAGDVESLAKAVTALVGSPHDERCAAAELSERVLAEYSWDKITRRTEEVYQRALDRDPTPTAPEVVAAR